MLNNQYIAIYVYLAYLSPNLHGGCMYKHRLPNEQLGNTLHKNKIQSFNIKNSSVSPKHYLE